MVQPGREELAGFLRERRNEAVETEFHYTLSHARSAQAYSPDPLKRLIENRLAGQDKRLPR